MLKKIIENIYVFSFRIKNKVMRELMLLFKLRPDSRPYITGDGFRVLSHHIYDEIKKCKAEDVQDNQIVFLKSDMIDEWFSIIHPKIKARYKLITHNSDYNVKDTDLKYIDDKIIKWFAQNVITRHSKLIPIPIGINNKYWYNLSSPSLYDKYRKIKYTQKNKIIFGFSINTNPKERQIAYDYLIRSKIADKIRGRNYPKTYMELIKKYKFIAAPNGNGLDDPRRWQALYFDIIPIVTRSVAMEFFKDSGLPFYIIDSWNDLDKLEEKDLDRIYNEMMAKKNYAPLFIDYWEKIIKKNE